ncbi:MAG: InlB B-repeat-containing protein [Erysipelotrichaceae bacterium]|nr:InlB B-repeat-containing protein [Erysipelotrichaceae bacterium]
MKKKMSILTAFMVLLLLVTVGGGKVAKAENQTVADSDDCYEIGRKANGDPDILKFNFDKSTLIVPAGFADSSESNKIIPNEPVDFVYAGGLNYFGEPVTVTVTVEYKGRNSYYNPMKKVWPNHDDGGVWVTADKEIEFETFGTDYDVKITFTDKNGDPFKFTGATIFNDPDQANYLGFTSEEIYYVDAGASAHSWTDADTSDAKLSDFYEYDPSNGLIRKDSSFDQLNDDNENVRWLAFKDGIFGVMIKDSSTFSYTINGKDDYTILPDFFIVYVPYNIEYYYMVDGAYLDTPDDSEKRGPVKILEEDPETKILKVMDPLPNVKTIDGDLDPQKDGYVLDEDWAGNAWDLQLKADGSTTLKVYFKQVYEVIYHDNGSNYGWTPGDAFADQKKSDYEYPETVISFDGTPYKEGYTFLGWSKDPKDKSTLYTTEEVMQFFARDHHDYWAQWKKNEPYVVPGTSAK